MLNREDTMARDEDRCPECDSRQHRNCGLSFDDFMLGMKAAAVNAVHEIMARPTCADCDKRVAEDEVRCTRAASSAASTARWASERREAHAGAAFRPQSH
jgi:RNA polymerase subunit RPABC4/transcription elongation factor Spt4